MLQVSRIITEETRKEMKKVLDEIQNGTFASNWIAENKAGGRAKFLATRRKESEHQLEKVGAELRKMMSWLEEIIRDKRYCDRDIGDREIARMESHAE